MFNINPYKINWIHSGLSGDLWTGPKINQPDADKIKYKNIQKFLKKGCTNACEYGIIYS